MMKTKNILGLFILILLLSSCKDGKMKTYHANGKVYEVISIKEDSTRHGNYTRHDELGNLQEESIYKDGKLDQVRKIFHPNGQIKIEESYIDGQFSGPYNVYDENGILAMTMDYKNNVIVGTSKSYYPSGTLKEEVTFANNEENGPFKEYHPNGKMSWKGTYRKGDNEFGLLEEFDSTGTIIKKMMCDSIGVCRTTWKIDVGDIKIES